jgi:phage tail sheath protein FI
MPSYLTPGLYFETVDLDSGQLNALRTDVAGFLGISAQGPLHLPVRITSWEQFQSTFGSFIAQGFLAYAVNAFFENGGRVCYVTRVAADEASTSTDMLLVQPADGSSSFAFSVDGFVPGAVVTVRLDEMRQADHLLKDVLPATRELVWDSPLEAELIGQPLDFLTGPASASATLLDESGKLTLSINASSPGVWGNRLSVRVARSSNAATHTRNAIQPASRLASFIESVVGFTVGSLVKIFQDQTPSPPLITYGIVSAVNAGSKMLSWTTALDAGYDLTKPISFETLEFSLSVYLDGHVREIFDGLSLVPEHPRYIEKAITDLSTKRERDKPTSNLIHVLNLLSPSALPHNLPDPLASNLRNAAVRLRAGRDGLAALHTRHFTGETGASVKQGVRAFEEVDEVSIVAAPDILVQPVPPPQISTPPVTVPDPCSLCPPPLPDAATPPPPLFEQAPAFSLEEIFRMEQALVEHCERMLYRIALLDPPLFSGPSENLEVGEIQGWRQRFDSKYAALYFPWVRVYDPLHLGGNVVRTIPPSGHVAGIYARNDLTYGVHHAPANQELLWSQDVAAEVNAGVHGILNPEQINCIRVFPGRGLLLYGARTVSSDPDWRFVNVRRLLMMIEKTLQHALQWTVFEPNNQVLRRTLTVNVTSFLEALWEQGALVGVTDKQAFYVKCDDENNPPEVSDAGQLVVEVGVAPSIPAEFVVFRLGRTTDKLEVTE